MQQGIFWSLIGVVCLSPLPLASNRPLPWTILALSVGLLLLAWGVMRLLESQLEAMAGRAQDRRDVANEGVAGKHRRRRQRRSGADAGEWPLAKYSLVFFLGFTLLVGWYWLQTSRLSAPLAHPAWASGFKMVLWFPKTEYAGSLTSTFINRNSYATYAGIQPPMPTAWPGAADSIAPSEPEDVGLPDSGPDPKTPGAKIYELPRNRGNRHRD